MQIYKHTNIQITQTHICTPTKIQSYTYRNLIYIKRRNTHIRKHEQQLKHTNIQTNKNTHIQLYIPTNIQSYKYRKCMHANIQTSRNTNIQTYTPTNIQSYTYRNTKKYTQKAIHTNIQTQN